MSTSFTPEFFAGLPKAELHVHLEGTLEPEQKLAFAQRNNIKIPQSTVEEIKALYTFKNLSEFLAAYYDGMAVLKEEQDFYDLATAYFQRAAKNGVKHVEPFFDPQAHTSRGVPIANVIHGFSRAAKDAANLGLDAKLVLCFLRDMTAESASETLEAALPFREHFIGVGLDSDEKGNPPEKFTAVFEKARLSGLHLTMHCDVNQEGSIKNIENVLKNIEVERIDHGSNIVEDDSLLQLAVQRGIGFTNCPISNKYGTGLTQAEPIAKMLRAGAKVTINSDDPAYFASYIAENYSVIAADAAFSLEEIAQIAKNSFDASWITPEEKEAYKGEVDQFITKTIRVVEE